MADGIMLTTGNGFDGYEIKEYLGIVSGEAILGSNFIKGIAASVTNVSEQDMAKVEKAKEEAEGRLLRSAAAKKANAIIGIQSAYTTLEGGSFGAIVTGTAVIIEPVPKPPARLKKDLVVMNYYARLVPRPVKVMLEEIAPDDIQMKVLFFNYNKEDILAIRGNVEYTNLYDERLVVKDVDFAFRKGNVTQIESEPLSAQITANDVLLLKEARVIISKYATPRGVFACNDSPINVSMSVHRLEALKAKRGIDAVEKYQTDGMIWTCNCGHVNEAGTDECIVCGRKHDDIRITTSFNYEEMIDRMKEKEYVIEIKDVLMEYIKSIDSKYRLQLLEIMESGLQYEKTRGNMKDTVIEKVEKVFEDDDH
ncbi:MAG: heavy metal-binding domain-containing protein [Eubacterium sp.]|nr:heavy metal-binding domain-containing protein [Eubacterium sp.]